MDFIETRIVATDPTGGVNRPDWYPSTSRNRPDWAVLGSDVTTVAPDEILMHGQWFLTPKRPPKLVVVVVRRKESRIDPICKENHKREGKLHGGRSQGRWRFGQWMGRLGQPVGPTSLEGNSRQSSGLD
ncbi:hypothetical protein CRG98_006165 [Punica granatum]|uniref:Uncharacterized protein n=1 Tax=Punica granatum TaxID=22663 RepID=A0A2I0KYC1_PUNGR|nr:hypothetical protein CRG98_006165 [Punica granatum]